MALYTHFFPRQQRVDRMGVQLVQPQISSTPRTHRIQCIPSTIRVVEFVTAYRLFFYLSSFASTLRLPSLGEDDLIPGLAVSTGLLDP